MSRPLAFTLLLAAIAGCAGRTPGAEPHDMSVAQHEEEARRKELEAEGHTERYDPTVAVTRLQCGTAGYYRQVCWTSVVNPTESHLREAERQRRMAADHRAASTALQQAEAASCAGVAPEERDIGPFVHTEDILAVEPIEGSRGRTQGAAVTLRAVPGLSQATLQRIVDCHLARNAALGHDVPEMPDCPLVPLGARAVVTEAADGFVVEIRADDSDAAADILARARRAAAAVTPRG